MLDLEKPSFHAIWYSGPFNLTSERKLYFYTGNHISSVSICFVLLFVFSLLRKGCLTLSSSATFSLIKKERRNEEERILLSRKTELFSGFIAVGRMWTIFVCS